METSSTSAAAAAGLLEWELSLPAEQIVSHGWYHGALGRPAAEALLRRDRQFLVRDSASQPGNYVLSCCSNTQHLHFVIQRIVVHPETVYERHQYQFEDEAYDTVTDLITSYVGSGKPISAASGARIQYPVNRTAPLTSGAGAPEGVSAVVSHVEAVSSNPYSLYSHFAAKPGISRAYCKPRSHSLTPVEAGAGGGHAKSASADGVITNAVPGTARRRDCLTWDAALPVSPPAKPPAPRGEEKRPELQRLYLVSGSDSGNGSGDSAHSGAHAHDGKGRENDDLATPTVRQQFDYEETEARLLQAVNTRYSVPSRIDVATFQSQIILAAGGRGKPLEADTLHSVKLLLRTAGPRILAAHLTKVDLQFLLDESPLLEGIDTCATGLELLFLPQGRSLRDDVIERIETFRLLVGVTVLTCATDRARADCLNDWIQLAVETKTALGNLHGFSAIMFGLCMPQVECLEGAWNILRREHTDSAFTFEAKLRPCFKSMHDGTNPPPPNTTAPYVLPPVLLFHTFDEEDDSGSGSEDEGAAAPVFPGALEHTLAFDFGAAAAHLAAARQFPSQVSLLERNARTVVMEAAAPAAEPALLELFRPEFHAQFLWGERGAATPPLQRRARLYDVLSTMAAKLANAPSLGDDVTAE